MDDGFPGIRIGHRQAGGNAGERVTVIDSGVKGKCNIRLTEM
jgi:hypothetical protein